MKTDPLDRVLFYATKNYRFVVLIKNSVDFAFFRGFSSERANNAFFEIELIIPTIRAQRVTNACHGWCPNALTSI